MAKLARQLPFLFTILLLAAASVVGTHESNYRDLSGRLSDAFASAREQRWERPVLRGAMRDGNATGELYNALQDFTPLGPTLRKALAEKVFFGQPLELDQQQALSRRALPLRALRDAVQQGWAHTELALERGSQLIVPDYPKLMDAGLALLAQAQTSEPAACLQQAADVLRIGQDAIPYAPLEAASVQAHLAAFSARVIARCARNADLPTLRRTSHELRVLATHPAPIGTAIELETLATAGDLQRRAALADKGPLQVLQTVLERPQLLAAFQNYLHPERYRQVTPENYPDAMELWKREHDLQKQTGPEADAIEAHIIARLNDDRRAQAIVRILCVAVSALAERAYRGNTPLDPAVLQDKALIDPYQGQRLRYNVAKNGAELTLWAVGPDMRDDGGSDEWTEAGPRDITVHVALK
ncbi:MAG TPA: hypothetical protein VMF89_07610, partial [Polyangiales bacterium]|nr:hypothetical protein [Polyangiales bacterium]